MIKFNHIPKCEYHLHCTKLYMIIQTERYIIQRKLHERARRTKSCAVIGYSREQKGAILPTQDCQFCSHNNVSPTPKQNIFRNSKKSEVTYEMFHLRNGQYLASVHPIRDARG